ncbi:MAG: tetratricopeptide repeat protein [Promethearchaeota archaeon]
MQSKFSWHPAPPEITLETLFRPKATFCFLAGSGISLDSPSCLPTGYQFTKALLEQLIPKEKQMDVLALMNPERPGMRDPGDFLRFEQLMEYLRLLEDPELRFLDCYAECTTPNFNHLFLAHMLTRGHPIFTTNFDSLIEYALLATGIPQTHIFPVIREQQWRTRPKRKQRYVYKLHGSLYDIHQERDCRESLQATLEQIAQEKENVFQLESWKRQVLQSFCQKHDLLVLGYSGLDDFDILPTLWSIASPHRILWISHDSNRILEQVKIEMVQEKQTELSLEDSSSLDRVSQNILRFAQYQTRRPSHLVRVTVHTQQLLEWLWHRYIHQDLPDLALTHPKMPVSLPDLAASPAGQWLLTGKIFADRYLLSSSLQAYQMALSLIQSEKNQIQQVACLFGMGEIYATQGRLDDALTQYQQALKINEQVGDTRWKAGCLINIGGILKDQGRLDDALTYYRQALELDKQLQNFRGQARDLAGIGNILIEQGHLEEALKHHLKSLVINEQLGILRAKTADLTNIGTIFATQGRLDEAHQYYQQALEIDEQLGDFRGKATDLTNIANILYQKGRLDEALRHYQQALELDEQLDNLRGKAMRLTGIAYILVIRGRLDEAHQYYQQALEIAERLNDLRGKVLCLAGIGEVLAAQGRLDEALILHQQALELDEQLDDIRGRARELDRIGTILYQQEKLDQAHKYYQQALEIAEQLGDPRGKAVGLANIGNIIKKQGRWDEALSHYRQALKINEGLGNIRGKAVCLTNIGIMLAAQGRVNEALQHYREALAIGEQMRDTELVKTIQGNILALKTSDRGST